MTVVVLGLSRLEKLEMNVKEIRCYSTSYVKLVNLVTHVFDKNFEQSSGPESDGCAFFSDRGLVIQMPMSWDD